MATSEDNSLLFSIFVLSTIALPLVPYTVLKLRRAVSQKTKSIHCECSICIRSKKYHRSTFKWITSFLTCSNVIVVLLWIILGILAYHMKQMSGKIAVFEPFSILGLQPGASDSEIKKAYRRLSIQYHPDKNPNPEAHRYFVEYISKAYQALTDPISRENFEKYGHPDGRQGFQISVALPEILLNMRGASAGILLIWILGGCILLPLAFAVVYLSRSSKLGGNYIRRETQAAYFQLLKPSLAPSKVIEIFIKAAEFLDIPVRKSDEESLRGIFDSVKSELSLDLKNYRQAQAKFWKQHPALIKAELLIQAHLSRKIDALHQNLQHDCNRVLQLAPRLLEELLKMATIPRTALRHGWLRPAIGVIELSQCMVQAVPLGSKKAEGVLVEGVAPFLQLPHFSVAICKKIDRKVRTLQELQDMPISERAELLTQTAGLSADAVEDVEKVLQLLPSTTIDVKCETEGEDHIEEGDIVTVQAWMSLQRANGLVGVLPHAPFYPFQKEEAFWFLLADPDTNAVWFAQKVSFMDEVAAVTAASQVIEEKMEVLGANPSETSAAIREAVEKVKRGSQLLIGRFQAPARGNYNLKCFLLCDSWIGCDINKSLNLKVLKKSRADSQGGQSADEVPLDNEMGEEDETEEENSGIESEYSEDDEK